MGFQGVAPTPAPAPKAICPSCHRPIALLKSGKCLYCGEVVPGVLKLVEAKANPAPADFELAMVPESAGTSSRSRWVRGILAFGVLVLLVAGFMGACMRR